MLAKVGVSPGDITAIVNSHLHFDHCGNNSAFPGVPIYVQQAELKAAKEPHYTVPEWVWFPDAKYVPVQGTHSISLTGWSCTRHLDIRLDISPW